MTIITRYIAAAFLRMTALCVGAFASIYLAVDFLEKFRQFSQAHAKAALIALYYLYKLPDILVQVMPLSLLLATLLTLGGLARNGELTALKASGVSMIRIALPILSLGLLASLLVLLMDEALLPFSFRQMKFIEEVKVKKKDYGAFFRQNNIWYRDGKTIMQARLLDPKTRTLRDVTVWKQGDRMEPVTRIDAPVAEMTPQGWVLRNGMQYNFVNGSLTSTKAMDNTAADLRLKLDDLKKIAKYGDDMSFMQLRSYCAKLREGGHNVTRYVADMHAKLSLPFASFVMVFLGIPFALRGGRHAGPAAGIAISLGVGFGYFVINAVVLSFGHAGLLHPVVAAWAANFLFALTGIWLALTLDY